MERSLSGLAYVTVTLSIRIGALYERWTLLLNGPNCAKPILFVFYLESSPTDNRWEPKWCDHISRTNSTHPVRVAGGAPPSQRVDKGQRAHHRSEPLLRQLIRDSHHPGCWQSRRGDVRMCGPEQHWRGVRKDEPHSTGWEKRKGLFTRAILYAISDAIARTKRALPYPAPMFFFREASRGLERKLSHYLKTPLFPISANLAVFCRSVTRLETSAG